MGYNPKNDPKPLHPSHQTANASSAAARSERSDAIAFAALEQARAILATHKSAIKNWRY
ncbi:hypothetical protein DFLDMN_000731 [Cupriavidus sp. H19C3]|uniref:hypothetical protein n=1 Tax=Cupriavidus sp. H19C3 TaxID=3241603 RepID=UPI003BF79060